MCYDTGRKEEIAIRNKRLQNILNTFGGILLSCMISFLLGWLFCSIPKLYSNGFATITVLALFAILSCLVVLYYHYEYNRIGVEKKQTTRFLKQFYWVMSHVIFVFYMANTYDTYLKTYEKNIFGID